MNQWFTNEWRFCSHGWKERKTKSLFHLQTSDLCCVDESGLFIIVFPSKYCSCFPPDIPRHKQSVLATENPRINENLINFHIQKRAEAENNNVLYFSYNNKKTNIEEKTGSNKLQLSLSCRYFLCYDLNFNVLRIF